MTVLRKQPVALFVDRLCQQWIVRDREGNFWILPSVEDPCVNNARKPSRRRGTCVTVEKRGDLNITRGRVIKACSFLFFISSIQ